MIPRDPADIDALAAEYVLGTLDSQREEIRHLLEDGPAPGSDEADRAAADRLRGAVAWWERKLAALDEATAPVAPPEGLWPSIERRLSDRPATVTAFRSRDRERSAATGLRERLAAWRLVAGLAAAACLALVVWTLGRGEAPASAVALMSAQPNAAATGSFLVERRGDRLRVLALGAGPAPLAHDLELWSLAGGKPAPLGIVRPADYLGPAPFAVSGALPVETTVAISLEPAGGSRTGQPTGPVLYVGKLLAIARAS